MRKICFLYFTALVFTKGFSQDPLFTNTSQSLVYLNPSFAGSNGFIRKQALYRNQWANLSENYNTYYGGTDLYLKSAKAAISLSCIHDDAFHGLMRSRSLNFVYAQYFSLLDGKLKIVPSINLS